MANRSIRETGRSKFITEDQYRKILELSYNTNKRDYFLLYLIGNLGLRVSEAVRLEVEDFDLDEMYVVIRTSKTRRFNPDHENELLPIDRPLIKRLMEYCNEYGIKSGYLFRGRKSHLTKCQAQNIFYKYSRLIGIHASIHSLRHYRGFSVFEQTSDITAVRYMLRHKSEKTAQIYSHPTLKARRNILEKIPIVDVDR